MQGNYLLIESCEHEAISHLQELLPCWICGPLRWGGFSGLGVEQFPGDSCLYRTLGSLDATRSNLKEKDVVECRSLAVVSILSTPLRAVAGARRSHYHET